MLAGDTIVSLQFWSALYSYNVGSKQSPSEQ